MAGQYIEPMLPAVAADVPRFVGQCAVCRSWCRGTFCADCLVRHAAVMPRCRRCGLRTPAAVDGCGACGSSPPPFARTVCAVDYGFPWDGLITRYKFGGEVDLAAAFAGLLQRALPAEAAATLGRIVPVPLAPARLAERGYNQAWEIARRVARRLRVPADAGALLRPDGGPHQAGLPLAQRRQAVRRAFVADPDRRRRLAGVDVALVDDVMTSGATAAAAAQALLDAGAASVQVWVLARTPAPETA
jgi:ComF family protein